MPSHPWDVYWIAQYSSEVDLLLWAQERLFLTRPWSFAWGVVTE